MSEQQLLNYLMWLRERGQQFFVPTPVDLCDTSSKAINCETPALYPLKVIFVSLLPLNGVEVEMVSRIAAALTLQAKDFAILSADNFLTNVRLHPDAQLVVMGDDALSLSQNATQRTLAISHPGAMLKEPSLKISAWTTLQTLKSLL